MGFLFKGHILSIFRGHRIATYLPPSPPLPSPPPSRSLQTDQFINQFSCENVLTCKDLLVTVAKRGNGGDFPSWLPLTFNLLYELPKFIRSYLEREEK